MNGFGRSLGDGIIGLQALRIALDVGRITPDPVLFRLTGLPAVVRDLYAAADFCERRDLGWSHATPDRPAPEAASFGNILDLRDFAFDPAFRGVAMLDFFLRRLAVDPAEIPPEQRRNTWLAPRLAPARPPIAPGYVLVCPNASMALRDMPDRAHRAVLATLRKNGLRVATQGTPATSETRVPISDTLAELCGWIAWSALVVSTDTAMVHLADAFAIPCLAIFTTHRPDWRMRDYPLCRAIHRPADLPPALEFSRGPADVTAAQAAWLDDGEAKWLTDVVAEMVEKHVRPGRT